PRHQCIPRLYLYSTLFYRHFNFLHLLSLPNASNRFLSLRFSSHPFPTMSNVSPKEKPLSAGGWNQWELEMSSWLCFKGWWGYISGRVREPSPPAVGDLPGAARIRPTAQFRRRSCLLILRYRALEFRRCTRRLWDIPEACFLF